MARSQLLPSILTVVLGSQSQAWAQGAVPITAERAQRIDAVFAPWDNTRSPGCALGVSQNGTLVYSRGYGMSHLEHDVPITPASIFDVASIAKQFTAFSVGLLATEGRLSFDDDIRRYLPELPDYGQRITIRHLLSHTSGLRNTGDLFDLAGWRVSQRNNSSTSAASPLQEPVTENDVLRMAARQRSLDFVPGAEYRYNNSAYTLLAVIVKRVSGQSLREFAEARIFGPLGMRDTQFRDDPNTILRRRTSAYRPRPGGGWWISVPVSTTVGPWGLETTVLDLLKWERNFVDAHVGGRALLDEMQTSGQLNDGTSTGYGFGLQLGIDGQMRRVGHGGGDFGYKAQLVQYYSIRDPGQYLAIATLCNGRTIDAQTLTRGVAEILLGSEALAPTVAAVAPLPPAVSIGEAELAALAGTYWDPTSRVVVRLVINDGKLMHEGSSQAFVPLGGGRFRVGERERLFPPPRAGDPQQLHMPVPPPARPVVFSRVMAPSYSAAELEAYAGQYRSDELDATYTIAVTPERGLAVLREKVEPAPLTAVTLDTFYGYGQSLGSSVTFIRAPSGEVSGFTMTLSYAGETRRSLTFARINVAP